MLKSTLHAFGGRLLRDVGYPDVLAHRQRQHRPAELGQPQRLAGREVAALVEDPVVGQPPLVIDLQHPVVAAQRDGVVERVADSVHEADDREWPHAAATCSSAIEVVLDEVLLVQQVLRRVAGESTARAAA